MTSSRSYRIRVNWWSKLGHRIHVLTFGTPLELLGIRFYKFTVFDYKGK
jgi:hypothetical protein